MKILPKLKEKLENAKNTEEKKQIFLDAGIELDDSELEKIDAGYELPPFVLPVFILPTNPDPKLK